MTFKLNRWKKQPISSSNDETIGEFILIFLNVTFLTMVGYMGYFLYWDQLHANKYVADGS